MTLCENPDWELVEKKRASQATKHCYQINHLIHMFLVGAARSSGNQWIQAE